MTHVVLTVLTESSGAAGGTDHGTPAPHPRGPGGSPAGPRDQADGAAVPSRPRDAAAAAAAPAQAAAGPVPAAAGAGEAAQDGAQPPPSPAPAGDRPPAL